MTKEIKKEKTNDFKKKAIFVLSNKGGVGKSTISKLLFEYFMASKTNFHAYDCDAKVLSLHDYYSDTGMVDIIDVKNPVEQPKIINNIKTGKDILLYDYAGGQQETLIKMFGNLKKLIELFNNYNYEVVFFVPLRNDHQCIVGLETLLNEIGTSAKIYVVKNMVVDISSSFIYFDGTKSKKDYIAAINATGGSVLTLPILNDNVRAVVDAELLKFSEVTDINTGIFEYYSLTDWMNGFNDQLDKLGLI